MKIEGNKITIEKGDKIADLASAEHTTPKEILTALRSAYPDQVVQIEQGSHKGDWYMKEGAEFEYSKIIAALINPLLKYKLSKFDTLKKMVHSEYGSQSCFILKNK